MKIVTTKLFEQQLEKILELIIEQDATAAKNFKSYLDTIILNIPSKEKKYKKSLYFDNDNIKDVYFQGCVVVFHVDKERDEYLIMGITSK